MADGPSGRSRAPMSITIQAPPAAGNVKILPRLLVLHTYIQSMGRSASSRPVTTSPTSEIGLDPQDTYVSMACHDCQSDHLQARAHDTRHTIASIRIQQIAMGLS